MFFIRLFLKITGIIPALLGFLPKKYYLSEKFGTAFYKGPLIIVENHRGFLDYPVILAMFVFRRVTVIISELMFSYNKVLTFALKAMGVVKADRFSQSPDFIIKSVDILKKGGIILIYPEGKIETEDEIYEFKHSVAVISIKSGAPVLPIYHDGNIGFLKREKCLLGDLLYPEDYEKDGITLSEAAENFTDKIRGRIVDYKRIYDESIKKYPSDVKQKTPFMYNFVKTTAVPLIDIFMRPDIKYENYKAYAAKYHKNSMLIISNHTWWLDPPVIYRLFYKRKLRCVSAREIAQKKNITYTMQKIMNCIFINRGEFDYECMRTCINHLKEGGALLIFPEGHLNLNGGVLPFAEGTSLIAFASGAPVFPIYIDGNYRMFHRLHITVGEPFYPDSAVPGVGIDETRMALATQMMYDRVSKLGHDTELLLTDGEKDEIRRMKEQNKSKL